MIKTITRNIVIFVQGVVAVIEGNAWLGFDIGNGGSKVIFVMQEGKIVIPYLVTFQGHSFLPSLISIEDKNTIKIGIEAENSCLVGIGAWNLIGKSGLQEPNKTFSQGSSTDYTAPDMLKMFLERMVGMLIQTLGAIVKSIPTVISVPANFNPKCRTILQQVAESVGLNILDVIEEPIAALVSFMDHIPCDGLLVVLDIGAGTTDLVFLQYDAAKRHGKLISTRGIDVAGHDYDAVITAIIVEKLFDGIEPSECTLQSEIRKAAKDVKHQLSTEETALCTLVSQEFLQCEITRNEFVSRSQELTQQIFQEVRLGLEETHCTHDEAKSVILTGGGSLIPAIQNETVQFFHHATILRSDMPQHDVALGNAMLAFQRSQQYGSDQSVSYLPGPKIDKISTCNICVVTQSGENGPLNHDLLIAKNQPIPTEISLNRYCPLVPFQQGVHLVITCGNPGDRFDESDESLILFQDTIEIEPDAQTTSRFEISAWIDESFQVFIKFLDKKTDTASTFDFRIQLD